jgi:malonyl-CoA decarboxylase
MKNLTPSVLLDRTMENLWDAWSGVSSQAGRITRRLPALFDRPFRKPDPSLPPAAADDMRERIRECLDAKGGAVSARARAADLGRAYLELNTEGRQKFFGLLAHDFAPDRDTILALADRLRDASDTANEQETEHQLREALVPPREQLLMQFNSLPRGVKFLVDMRADLLNHLKDDRSLKNLDRDFGRLLRSWFDVGFLNMERVTWDAPAAILEKLIAYEAVHEIESWEDLKNRLAQSRRCYAFFHPRMPEEPLIFVEVALTEGIARNIQDLLDRSAPRLPVADATTAIFYSISNTQGGLQGVSFGNFLIKQVVEDLSREMGNLKIFSTLSPIPGFRRWLEKESRNDERPCDKAFQELFKIADLDPAEPGGLAAFLETSWRDDSQRLEALRAPLTHLCAHYLSATRSPGRSLDPVSRFHLTNGARIEHVNWMGDTSFKGLAQSLGFMVNYRYVPDQIEENHELYRAGDQVPMSSEVKSLLKT